MKELEDRIRKDGIVKAGGVLKVDAFLNHQCDTQLFDHMGAEWARLFADAPINKILTIEASGIGLACMASRHFGNAPVVFAKKAQSINLDGEQYSTTIYSFTKQREFPVIVGRRFLSEGRPCLDPGRFPGKRLRPRGAYQHLRIRRRHGRGHRHRHREGLPVRWRQAAPTRLSPGVAGPHRIYGR